MRDDWLELQVEQLESPVRLDTYLGRAAVQIGSRAKAQQAIAAGNVLVDDTPAVGKLLLRGGEVIRFRPAAVAVSSLVAEPIELTVVYEDKSLAVIDKPAGLVTHPGAGNPSGTLVNGLLHRFRDLSSSDPSRPGIVHRLDKETSGLLLVAKNDQVAFALQRQLAARQITRLYLAIACGHMPQEQGMIDFPLARSANDRTLMSVQRDGRAAITEYRLLDRFRSYDLLELRLHTGRTHQIRAHLSHLNHPVFGDTDYGGRERWHRGLFAPERPLAKRLLGLINRQALHAWKLSLNHPVSGKLVQLTSAIPLDFQSVLDLLTAEGR